MGKYFGTDGIRGVYGDACMNDSFAFRIGLALSRYLCEIYSGGKIKVAIGQDTRASGADLVDALTCGLQKNQIAEQVYFAENIYISAGTLSELFLVPQSKGVLKLARNFVEELQLQIIPFKQATAEQIEKIHIKWRKGFNPACLNFGDCFVSN